MKFVGHRFGFGSLPLKADTGGDGKPTLDLTWNGQYQLVSVSTNGVFAECYGFDALGRRVSTTTAEGTLRHVYDANWQVIADLDEHNNVVARWQYDAWGNVVDEEIAFDAAALASLRYRFQGREWSAATGLINFRMRWYDAETGRWLSKDPIGLSGGLNLYAFCDDNPVSICDWIGLCPDEEFSLIVV